MDEIRALISDGRIEEAIEELILLSEEDQRRSNMVLQIAARFNRLKEENLEGVLSTEAYNLEYNRILHSLLEITGEPDPPRRYSLKKILLFSSSGLVMLLLIALAYWKPWETQPIVKPNEDPPKLVKEDPPDSTISPPPTASVQGSTKRIDSQVITTQKKQRFNYSARADISTLKKALSNTPSCTAQSIRIDFDYAPDLTLTDRERDKYNYEGGNAVLKINDITLDLPEIKLRAWKLPTGNPKSEVEKNIYGDLNEQLRQRENTTLIIQKIKDHVQSLR